MAESLLITPRRNFLIRALGFTAAGASVAVPIVTMDSAEARLKHHLKGVEDAMRDLFPLATIEAKSNCIDGEHVIYADRMQRGENSVACAFVTAQTFHGA